MVNVNKLRGKIVEKQLTIEQLADILGINKSTLYRKMVEKGETFTIREADMICDALDLSGEEATAIFFDQYVA